MERLIWRNGKKPLPPCVVSNDDRVPNFFYASGSV
jgi:hypothetical protein